MITKMTDNRLVKASTISRGGFVLTYLTNLEWTKENSVSSIWAEVRSVY